MYRLLTFELLFREVDIGLLPFCVSCADRSGLCPAAILRQFPDLTVWGYLEPQHEIVLADCQVDKGSASNKFYLRSWWHYRQIYVKVNLLLTARLSLLFGIPKPDCCKPEFSSDSARLDVVPTSIVNCTRTVPSPKKIAAFVKQCMQWIVCRYKFNFRTVFKLFKN